MNYLLITPARNEEMFIELTIKSVIAQVVRPARWVIVSDGSTDRTDEIVARYADVHDWIELYRMPERETRDFGGKAYNVNLSYDRIKHIPHDFVCSLDADITFDPDYFQFLLEKLVADPGLGLVGTPFSEDGRTYDYRYSSTDHVSGACQLFRRECFQKIGGYVQAKGGGIDVIAVLSSRMKGWRTRTFTEKTCAHHRPMGTGNDQGSFTVNYKLGQRNYRLGFHPLWQTLRCVYQLKRKPLLVGGVALFLGYFSAMLQRMESPMSRELIQFQRQDQMRRLRAMIGIGGKAHSPEGTPAADSPVPVPVRDTSSSDLRRRV